MASDRTYPDALHAIQSGIRMQQSREAPNAPSWPGETSPKHLRVGVESALASIEGLTRLLMAKGLVTQDEVDAAILHATVERVEAREAELSKALGSKITLG